MFYFAAALPFAVLLAAAQFFLCKKVKNKITKFLPVLSGVIFFLMAEVIRAENLLADVVYGIFGRGIFALVVILWIAGISAVMGALFGWIFWRLTAEKSK
ncbi:MAG: hypothetical protein IKJ82_03305 [Oscillospiraceae bacterium]|nr:hypothetical protein [Oscillospiraceae bacterium]